MRDTGEEVTLFWKEPTELRWAETNIWTELMVEEVCEGCRKLMDPFLQESGRGS